ncbi:MAG: fibro-slime domain-containing protein [Clostridiales bacterium]|nr:fibro-slime domain-containing protein [Clostridiales bacterium]
MRQDEEKTVQKYAKERRSRKRWHRVATCLAAVVVFCTTYALILPAITMEKHCGLTEHIHTDACYTQVTAIEKKVPVCTAERLGIHQHTDTCYDADGKLICGQADYVVHHHDAACYDENGVLWCPLPETEAHQHTDSCYSKPEPAEETVHTHTDGCYTLERGDLLCQEHVHTDACYAETTKLICDVEESAGHQHDESCTDENGEIVCGQECSEGHQHTEGCYETIRELTCGSDSSHQHGDDCYEWKQVLTCDLPTEPTEGEPVLICGEPAAVSHQHTDACFETVEEPVDTEALTCTIPEDENHTHGPRCYGTWELTCGMQEHVHGEGCVVDEDAFCGKQAHTHDETCLDENGNQVCGLEEHTHTLSCYSDPEADVETREQWEQTFAKVTLTGDWRQDVIAIAETQLGYTESARNYAVWEDGTTHGYTRYGDWYGSPYGDWCAMFASFCIHYAGVEDMPLNWGCRTWIAELEPLDRYRPAQGEEPYSPEVGDLIFYDWEGDGLSDHVGLVAERIPETEDEPARLVAIEGNSANKVQSVTYDLDDPVILGYGLLPEQEFFCGKTGHVHTARCGSGCPLEEHIHTEQCELPAEEEVLTNLTFEGADYTVLVQYGPDAALPEGVKLEVSEIPGDSEEYQDYLSQTSTAMEKAGQTDTVVFARFFDIRFTLDGQTLEPAAPVSVTITYAEPVETSEDASCQAIHFGQEGTEILDVTTEQREDGSTSFTHTQNGFSVVGDVVTRLVALNPADNGPDRLPVDYYVCIDGVWTCVGSTKTGWYYTRNWHGEEGFTDYNRDYITVAQAVSILGPYGFTGNETNPSLVTAYQQKSSNTYVYSDTNTVSVPKDSENGTKILPLSRNPDHAGYNLYYLPNNNATIGATASPENLDKTANGFYTVKVFDAQGEEITSDLVFTGGSFTYDASASDVTSWLVARVGGTVEAVSGSQIVVNDVTTPVTISPNPGIDAGNHSVTFKVMIDGEWKTVGSLPYYYSGNVGGSDRAYITSAMAAQILGKYGYTADMAPGKHFGYSYNDIYKIFYAANTGYCMDVNGNKIENDTAVQLWTSNDSTAQMFRIWDAGEGYSYITPVENSAYHVNVLGGGTADGTKLGIHTAIDAASHWKVENYANGTTSFFNKNAPTTAAIDLPGGTIREGAQLQIYNNASAKYWKLLQQYRISNDTVSSPNDNGTYNIGLTPESNGDIICYYLPGETSHVYTDVKNESDIDTRNTLWSVSVRDDTHAVYSEGDLSTMVQYAPNGGAVTVTVQNADGILWSCVGKNGGTVEVESTQNGGETTFTIANITQPIEVTATKADPSFTVQYYANIPRFAASGDNPLKVIDTSGKILPTNGGTMATRNLYLEGTGQKTNQNAGVQTDLYRVKTTTELTKMYTEKKCSFAAEPGLEYFNKLKDNEDYVLKEIWVLKTGKSPDSTDVADWDVFYYEEGTTDFTNEAGQAVDGTILICDGAVIRLVFDASSGDYHNGTTFYDYNISSGQNSDGRWRTGITGINSESNYGTSGNGKRTWQSGADILAFGNANCGTGMSGYMFDNSTLNKYSSKNSGYGGATFGLASGLNDDGTIRYNGWIVAPKLFNDGDATGKQTYSGSSLTFDRVGDTYTLSSASLSGGGTVSDLQYFFHPSPVSGCIWDGKSNTLSKWQNNIFTNNFWPMDQAADKTDALWGQYGNPGKFQGFTETNGYNWSNLATNFPESDDGRAHNWFFGMNFALSFNLTADYEGPLEYYFFGDDDLWVFLDNRLICDIGGVHSSIGEYVNLRDYLPVGSSGQHTLSFFYTERGASGSTCWMSFTLPSVSSATTSRDTGSLQIEKKLENTGDMDFSGEEYKFEVKLLTAENGSALNQTFSYSKNDGTYGTIKSGGTIKLKQDETATISGIPAGTFYQVTELTTQGYHTTVNNNEGYIASGTIASGGIAPASFVNRPYMELPSTGGAGTTSYTAGGLLLIAAAAALLYIHNRRRKEDSPSS